MQPWSQPLLWEGAIGTCSYDPATISAGVVLSNANLSAHHSSGTNQGAHVYDVSAKNAGKWYYEMTYTTAGGYINGSMIGVAAVGTTYANFNASGTGGVSAHQNGSLFSNGTNTYNYSARAQGDVIGIAVDIDDRLVWFKVVSGTPGKWNGNTANGDPVAKVNGLTLPAGSIEPYTTFGTNTDTLTINLGHSAFVGAIPTGYSSWC